MNVPTLSGEAFASLLYGHVECQILRAFADKIAKGKAPASLCGVIFDPRSAPAEHYCVLMGVTWEDEPVVGVYPEELGRILLGPGAAERLQEPLEPNTVRTVVHAGDVVMIVSTPVAFPVAEAPRA